ncbi:MAG: hypothetical protein IJB59_10360 [Oscillospiraceae bacterium]|nr:hypothetical protein [Oscillospiraceae bacterium]
MAKYNREFLVPYLENVCALHLVYKKLDQRICDMSNKDIPYLRRGKHNPKPEYPQKESMGCMTFGALMLSILGIPSSIVGIFDPTNDMMQALSLFLILPFSIFCLWLVISSLKGINAEYKYNILKYHADMEHYKEVNAYNNKLKKLVPVYLEKFEFYIQERDYIDVLLDRVYAANIIPRRYRDIYAAMYLYDWFSTSQANDLDMALNTFVLEEIKDKLDIMIAQQSESILNQRMILANQQQSLEQQQRHSNMMRAKLSRIASSNEERNTYLRMIESNTAVTAFFAAADYIQNL